MTDLLIIGPTGGTNVASSLQRGASEAGIASAVYSPSGAYGDGLLQKLAWRVLDKHPLNLSAFLNRLLAHISEENPRIVLVLGGSPMTAQALTQIRNMGIRTVHFSTDDPFNPVNGSARLRKSLPQYDAVFTPRRSNVQDLEKLGCARVLYLPFGIDPYLFKPPAQPQTQGPDVLFVGGGDADRFAFFCEYLRHGPEPTLVGVGWDRFPSMRKYWIGVKNTDELTSLTAAAAVNICLVRRANRDGHVMRSFEIPALGGFMLGEDTQEHRDLFGPDGECLQYFSSPAQAAHLARRALEDPAQRRRMADALHTRVMQSGHTYADRVRTMVAAVD